MPDKSNSFKIGAIPAILAVFVTFALSVASADSIADLLNMPWIKWPLIIGFLSGEALIIAWYLEPQKGIYTKKQLSLIQSAKYVLLSAGIIDGGLLIAAINMDNPPLWITITQAVVSISAIFWCAIASMVLVDNDAERIIAVEKADVRLKNRIAQLQLELERKKDQIKTKQIRLKISAEIRRQIGTAAQRELSSPEMRKQLDASGRQIARAVVTKFLENADRVIGQGGGVSKIDQDDSAKKSLAPAGVNGKVFVN